MVNQSTWAWIAGIVLILVGLLGFFNDPILGIFPVNGLHNIVHVLTGLLFVWGAISVNTKEFNRWLGIVYLVLAIIGFIIPLTFLDMTSGADPDNFLHLFIGLISTWVGSLSDKDVYRR